MPKKNNLLLLCGVLFLAECSSQKEEPCRNIVNESKMISVDVDSVCNRLQELNKLGLSLFFYLKDEQINSVEKKRYSDNIFSSPQLGKDAIIFINISSKDFTTLFADLLKTDDLLNKRRDFQTFVYNKLKKMDANFFFDIISEYQQLFSDEKRKAF